MNIAREMLDTVCDLDKQDFLVVFLMLVITFLIVKLQQLQPQTVERHYGSTVAEIQRQEVTPRREPLIGGNVSVESTSSASVVAGVLTVKNLSIEQQKDAKEQPPDLKAILSHMQTMLRKRYKDIRIRGLPWLPEVSFSLEECYVHLTLTDQETKLELSEIFNQTPKSIKPTRILVEGGAGYGKTTLTCKLCYDWVNNVEYMACFDLVIVLHLRYFKEDFRETLAATLNIDTYSNIEAVLQTISVNATTTLLVLEGYDEAPAAAEEYLHTILRGDLMKRVTVLITSRPGKFAVGRIHEANTYHDVVEDLNSYLDKKITIVGLLQEHQQEFLEKHLKHLADYSSKKLDTVRDHLEKMMQPDFLACPLFLLMLVFVCKDGDIQKVKSKTDLFKRVFNFILQRFLSKTTSSRGASKMPRADMFKFHIDKHSDYVTILSALGELAISALEKDRLFFTHEELLSLSDDEDMLLQIGLVNPTIEVNGIWKEIYYEPVHKSLLEFLAAYHLWVSFLINPTSFKETLYSHKLVRPTMETAHSLTFPFLCGLFDKSCDVLFKSLKPFASEYLYCFEPMCFSLQECNLTQNVMESLQAFFPTEWKIPWYHSDTKFATTAKHQTLLQCALQSGNTEIIKWFLDSPAFLPHSIRVKVLVLVVGAQQSPCKISDSKYGLIQCADLWCDLRTPVSCSADWEVLMQLIRVIKKSTISFMLCTTHSFLWLPFVHRSTLQRMFGVDRIHLLHCWVKRKKSDTISLINELIQTENLNGLNLFIVPSSLVTPVFDMLRNAIHSLTAATPRSPFAAKDAVPSQRSALPLGKHKQVDDVWASIGGSLVEDTNITSMCTQFQKGGSMLPLNPVSTCVLSQDTSTTSSIPHFHSSSFAESIQQCSEPIHPNQQTLSLSSATTSAITLGFDIFQEISNKISAEFGSAASEFITSLRVQDETIPTHELTAKKNEDASVAGKPIEQKDFGCATIEYITSLSSSASQQQDEHSNTSKRPLVSSHACVKMLQTKMENPNHEENLVKSTHTRASIPKQASAFDKTIQHQGFGSSAAGFVTSTAVLSPLHQRPQGDTGICGLFAPTTTTIFRKGEITTKDEENLVASSHASKSVIDGVGKTTVQVEFGSSAIQFITPVTVSGSPSQQPQMMTCSMTYPEATMEMPHTETDTMGEERVLEISCSGNDKCPDFSSTKAHIDYGNSQQDPNLKQFLPSIHIQNELNSLSFLPSKCSGREATPRTSHQQSQTSERSTISEPSENPSFSTTKEIPCSSTETNWMKTYNNLSADVAVLVEEFGVAVIATLESLFGTHVDADCVPVSMVENYACNVNKHFRTLFEQTVSLAESTPGLKTIFKFLPTTASLYMQQLLPQIPNTCKMFSCLHSTLDQQRMNIWIDEFSEEMSSLNTLDVFSKQVAGFLRLLASILNTKAESVSGISVSAAKQSHLLVILEAIGQTFHSSILEAGNHLTEGQVGHFLAAIRAICTILKTILEDFEAIFVTPSKIRTLSSDCIMLLLFQLEALSASILSIIEDPTCIHVFLHLAQAMFPEVSSLFLFFADLLENVDETKIDINKLQWLKDATYLFCSFASSLLGLSFQFSPLVTQILNTFFKCISITFPTVVYVLTIIFETYGTSWNETLDEIAWDDTCTDLLSTFHMAVSNLLQMPIAKDNLEKLILMLNPSSIGNFSPYWEESTNRLQSSNSFSTDGSDFLPLSQSEFTSLICSASKSEHLKSFAVSNLGTVPLTICVNVLCNHGRKSWSDLKINGDVTLCCSSNLSTKCEVGFLDIRIAKDATNDEVSLESFQTESLHCSQQLLMRSLEINDSLMKSLREVKIYLSSPESEIIPMISAMKHIQTLALTLPAFEDEDTNYFSVKELLSVPPNTFNLKRFEIWNLSTNPSLASSIVKDVVDALSNRSVNGFNDEDNQQLECLLLNLDIDIPSFKTVTSIMQEHFKQSKRLNDVKHIMEHPERRLLDLASLTKQPLRDKVLNTVELVCMSKPPVWENIFLYSEGFVIKHSMMRKQLNTARRNIPSHLIPFTEHQFMVTFMPKV